MGAAQDKRNSGRAAAAKIRGVFILVLLRLVVLKWVRWRPAYPTGKTTAPFSFIGIPGTKPNRCSREPGSACTSGPGLSFWIFCHRWCPHELTIPPRDLLNGRDRESAPTPTMDHRSVPPVRAAGSDVLLSVREPPGVHSRAIAVIPKGRHRRCFTLTGIRGPLPKKRSYTPAQFLNNIPT